jgi:hypothetical protein
MLPERLQIGEVERGLEREPLREGDVSNFTRDPGGKVVGIGGGDDAVAEEAPHRVVVDGFLRHALEPLEKMTLAVSSQTETFPDLGTSPEFERAAAGIPSRHWKTRNHSR